MISEGRSACRPGFYGCYRFLYSAAAAQDHAACCCFVPESDRSEFLGECPFDGTADVAVENCGGCLWLLYPPGDPAFVYSAHQTEGPLYCVVDPCRRQCCDLYDVFFSHLCFWIDEKNHYKAGLLSSACFAISIVLLVYLLLQAVQTSRAADALEWLDDH